MAIARRTGITLLEIMSSIGYPFYKFIRLERLEFLDAARLDELFDHTSLGLRRALEGVMRNLPCTGCTRQSLAENSMFRFKCIFGSRFRARRFDNQRVEGWIKCMVLHRMVSLGLPASERIY
jgi:hypothetical protein